MTRILPVEEWSRLAGTELDGIETRLRGDQAVVMVDEAEDGTLRGCWAALWVLHVEGLWVSPTHRGRGAVLRRLLVALDETTRQVGVSAVVAGVADETMAALVAHAGATALGPMQAIPVPMVTR
jgi:hypothetical protein